MSTRLHFSAFPVVHPDFPAGHMCVYTEHQTEELVYTVLSLCFGKR